MEQHRLPRHSSSHGTLHSSYSHGRVAHGPSPIRPLHKPLRSVNENSVLLPSPGALESMLKTTTETGDIGIFSIRPVPPSPQRRDTLSDIGQQHCSPRPSIEELRHRNNGKYSSSCRDTASEIISMYGSESHKSTTSTLTPASSEDVGLRSYSMTTCGSRHLSHHRSTTTLQSQASGGPLQRPRSPFPYPTRLKRPGVRPASPALTEGGRVDYSRMVEIDRTFLRTAHGAYKPIYPPMLRRPPPLGLRSDTNQSTISLPSQGLTPSRHGLLGPSSMRTPSVSSMASWSAPYRERLYSPSSRTSSLTSTVNMYHRPSHALRPGPSGLSAAVPRYYDYTEGFENKQSRVTTPVQPFAPVPTRGSDCQRPLVLQESDDDLAIAFGRRNSTFYESENRNPDAIGLVEAAHRTNTPRAASYQTTIDRAPSRCRTNSIRSEIIPIVFEGPDINRKFARGSDIDLLPSQIGRDSMDTFNASLDLDSKDAPAYRYTDYRSTATPKTKPNPLQKHVQVQGGRTPTIRSEQGVILRDDTQDETLHEEGLHGCHDADLVEGQVTTSPQGSTTGQRSCSEPTQDHLNDPTRHEELPDGQLKSATMSRANLRHSKVDSLGDRNGTTDPNDVDDAGCDIRDSGIPTVKMGKLNLECNDVREVPILTRQLSAAAQRQKFQRHRRNQAIPRISTSSLPREDSEGFQYISPSCSATPIVSPKPISPARQLKLKNSIPQLMKALPPIPGDPDYVPSPATSILSTSSNGDDFPELLSPFKFNQPSVPLLCKDAGIRMPNVHLNSNRAPGSQKNAQRLRLKPKKSNGSGARSSSDTKLFEIENNQPPAAADLNTNLENKEVGHGAPAHARNKLKLRSSRSTTSSTPPPGTVRHVAVMEGSGSIADTPKQQPRDLFNFPSALSPASHPVNTKLSQTPYTKDSVSDVLISNKTKPKPEKKPALLRKNTQGKFKYDPPVKSRTGFDARQPRRLKRHLSNLRCLLVGASNPTTAISDEATTQDKSDQNLGLTDVELTSGDFANRGGGSIQGSSDRTAFGRRMRSKVLRWVKYTKTAVRTRAKRNRGT
ncbi:uncharacterized protein F4822DRAFT_38491 [Hypoxylon trugodes]|uniref:uncharacterized protein n=1 Tax=Hypoxylon trugodes TaxID=326681 RepID=UPI0021A0F1E0|nr:uncharacterized protein F4822DRAFT_38491 [Hypoxylon trugodes]KAI1394144.1 hypothetical protein F4822DRAFT_38491 [Hypoxylon trugodes]